MSERERTIIRVAGLAVHAVGLLVLLVGIGTGIGPGVVIGLVMFAVGGAWGWGMVAAAARESERVRLAEQSHRAYLERTGQAGGFTSTFDDEPEPALLPPPTGAPAPTLPAWPGEG
jgi:hypothetical protein